MPIHFPVMLGVGSFQVPPHPVLETLAYTLGFQLYRWQRRAAGDALAGDTRMWVIAGALVGAATGSKVLFWLVDPALTWAHLQDPAYMLMGGKTLVGGLAGGLWGVEFAKRRLGITRSTGDLFAVPLAVGIAIGRIGCFLQGMSDRTYGLPTSLAWGVDFGDGIPRHPTQLYETGFGLLLAVGLTWLARRPHAEGAVFRTFMIGYMTFRLLIEGLKPGVALAGLTSIQWACVAVLVYYAADALVRSRRASTSPLARGPVS